MAAVRWTFMSVVFGCDFLWSDYFVPQKLCVSGTLSGKASDMNVQATGIAALGRAG